MNSWEGSRISLHLCLRRKGQQLQNFGENDGSPTATTSIINASSSTSFFFSYSRNPSWAPAVTQMDCYRFTFYSSERARLGIRQSLLFLLYFQECKQKMSSIKLQTSVMKQLAFLCTRLSYILKFVNIVQLKYR